MRFLSINNSAILLVLASNEVDASFRNRVGSMTLDRVMSSFGPNDLRAIQLRKLRTPKEGLKLNAIREKIAQYNHLLYLGKVYPANGLQGVNDLYDMILFGLLCEISSNNIEHVKENKCRKIKRDSKQEKSAMHDIEELLIKAHGYQNITIREIEDIIGNFGIETSLIEKREAWAKCLDSPQDDIAVLNAKSRCRGVLVKLRRPRPAAPVSPSTDATRRSARLADLKLQIEGDSSDLDKLIKDVQAVENPDKNESVATEKERLLKFIEDLRRGVMAGLKRLSDFKPLLDPSHLDARVREINDLPDVDAFDSTKREKRKLLARLMAYRRRMTTSPTPE